MTQDPKIRPYDPDGLTSPDPPARDRNPSLNATQTPPPESSSSASGAVTSPGTWFAAPTLEPGKLLGGRYEILRLLGEGGMGSVYQARDVELDRLVALKVIRADLAGNPAMLQRFKQELILASQVTHKNVVRIYDLGEAEGIRFITMEFVDGEDLRTLLKQQLKFTPEESVATLEQVGRALQAAHAVGVIHRDLKPQNIMRDSAGRIVVMDFGLARSVDSAGMTQTGALVGTMEYMSPEQAMGTTLDQRSDIFAAGLIFYELLTGQMPYKAESALASLMKRTSERVLPASQLDASVPQRLSAIVNRCLERDPNQRYSTAADLVHDLETWHADPSLKSVAKSPASVSAPRSVQINLALPSQRGWLWGVAAVFALLAGFFALPTTRHWVFPAAQSTQEAISGIPPLAGGKFVAILPLRLLGSDQTLRYVADGLAEALSTKLFQVQEVHVSPASAVEKAFGKEQNVAKLAQALGANLLLQGSVQGATDHFRVTLELLDVGGEKRVWSQEFDSAEKDLLTLEDNIYGNLISALALKPSSEEFARGTSHPTDDIDAYDLYLRGRNAMRGWQDVKNVDSAIDYYGQALKKDPRFSAAYAGMSDAYLRMYKTKKESLWAQKAVQAAQQAVSLNQNLAEAHFALASAYSATGKAPEAVAEVQRALEIAPNSDEGYRRLGDAYRALGRKAEAIQAYQKATAINPYYWANHNALGSALRHFGELDGALNAFRRVTELEPDNAAGYENMGVVLSAQGKYNESVQAYEKAIQLQPYYGTYSNLGTSFFFLKRYNEAASMFAKAVEMNPNDAITTGNLADAQRWSEHQEESKATYDKAIALAYKELQVNPKNASILGYLALYYGKKGDTAQALETIHRARSIDSSAVELIYDEATVQQLAGREDAALKSLREAFQKGQSPDDVRSDPEFHALWDRPEFVRLASEFSKKK
jgi:serine/threonine protein kinase/tetratricopeptide (TPR) repeat protein